MKLCCILCGTEMPKEILLRMLIDKYFSPAMRKNLYQEPKKALINLMVGKQEDQPKIRLSFLARLWDAILTPFTLPIFGIGCPIWVGIRHKKCGTRMACHATVREEKLEFSLRKCRTTRPPEDTAPY